VCLPYVLVLQTFPEQTAEIAQHSTRDSTTAPETAQQHQRQHNSTREYTTAPENTQHNKQYSIM